MTKPAYLIKKLWIVTGKGNIDVSGVIAIAWNRTGETIGFSSIRRKCDDSLTAEIFDSTIYLQLVTINRFRNNLKKLKVMITDSECTCRRGIEGTGIGSVVKAKAELEDNGILNHKVKRERERRNAPLSNTALFCTRGI